jgi:hypothetical protein
MGRSIPSWRVIVEDELGKLKKCKEFRTSEENEVKKNNEGPLGLVFGGPVARVLDQARIVGNMEQTVPMPAESTGMTFKTVH